MTNYTNTLTTSDEEDLQQALGAVVEQQALGAAAGSDSEDRPIAPDEPEAKEEVVDWEPGSPVADNAGFKKIKQGGPRCKAWVFTAWSGWSFKDTWKRSPGLWKYMIAGQEICPDTGRHHFQGYLQCKRRVRRSVVQNAFQTGPNTGIPSTSFLPARSGWKENYEYCRKIGKHLSDDKPSGNTWTQCGEPDKTPYRAGSGTRTDILEAYTALANGAPMVELLHNNPPAFAKSYGAFARMQSLLREEAAPRRRPVKVIWIEGPTGIGKTHAVFALENDLHVQHMKDGFTYWDGYDAQEAILIDEYCNDAKITHLFGYLDDYTTRINIKYGYRQSVWKRVYICTNLPWHLIHPRAARSKREALTRRVDERWEGWDTTATEVSELVKAGNAFDFFGDVVTLATDQAKICGEI